MTFDDAMREAALRAEAATRAAMKKYADGGVFDEPEITGVLVGRLDAAFDDFQAGGLVWKSTIVRNGSGSAAEEKRVGADLLLHVEVDTPTQSYSKGVLIQSKRAEYGEPILGFDRLKGQCNRMLSHSPSSFVFVYAHGAMRCSPATRILGSKSRVLSDQALWTSYRFYLELFRCPVGDPRITSQHVRDLPCPKVLHLRGVGEVDYDSKMDWQD